MRQAATELRRMLDLARDEATEQRRITEEIRRILQKYERRRDGE
jgi:hypothetical protein